MKCVRRSRGSARIGQLHLGWRAPEASYSCETPTGSKSGISENGSCTVRAPTVSCGSWAAMVPSAPGRSSRPTRHLHGAQGLDGSEMDLRLQVQERMDVGDKHHDFEFNFGGASDGDQVTILLRGIHPERGQTLASTGLTVWRGAEEMARFMWEHRRWFEGKKVVELGAGLGLCGALASYLCRGGKVVITDGGEEFTESAMTTLRENLEKNNCNMTDDRHGYPHNADRALQNGALVSLERLTWGHHAEFLGRHGDFRGASGTEGGFEFVLAADVIYYEEAVTPLLQTVVDILKLQLNRDAHRRGEQRLADDHEDVHEKFVHGGTSGGNVSPCPTEATFLLSFARRNVSIDHVLKEAEKLGLKWWVPDDFEPVCTSEKVYMMSLDRERGEL